MPFVLEAAALLTALARPNHIVVYVHGDLRSCRRAATPITLGITGVLEAAAALTLYSQSWFYEAGADKPRPYRSPCCIINYLGIRSYYRQITRRGHGEKN